VEQIAAIILAAGAGSRMGRTKQLLRAGGQSLVRRAATAAIEAGCKPVIVVTGSNSDAIAAEIADLSVQPALNANWSAGIGSSIRSGLAAALAEAPSISAVLLMLCDQPHLDAKILRDVMLAFSASNKPMAACYYSGAPGSPCCFANSMFDQLSRLPNTDGAKKLLLANPQTVTNIPWPQGEEDLDTPADWDRFCQSNPPPT
jgi:molybdenum cofactor cytidylyltransferase